MFVDLANPKNADHVFPEINHWVKQKTAEVVEVEPVIMNITSSAEVNQYQKCTCETFIHSTGMCVSSEGPLPPSSVEVERSAFNLLLQNDILHSVDAGFDEAPHPATSTSPQKEKSHAAETEPPEDPRSIGTQLLKIDSFHSLKPNFLEGLDSVVASNPKNDRIAITTTTTTT